MDSPQSNRIQIQIPAGLEDVAPQYLESKSREVKNYELWSAQQKFGEIEKASHKLKGTAASYGFEELGRLAKDLNAAAKAEDFSRVQAILVQMRDHLDRIDLVNAKR